MFLILLIFSLSSFAGTLTVEGHRYYKLEYGKEELLLTSPIHQISIRRKKCTEVIFQNFELKMKLIQNLKTVGKGEFLWSLNGKPHKDPLSSSVAKVIDAVPEELERMKIEEELRCKR